LFSEGDARKAPPATNFRDSRCDKISHCICGRGFVMSILTKVSMNNSQNILDRDDIVTILQGQMVRSRFGVKSLSLFGSAARNEATKESDLDFIVNFDGMITFDRYMDLKIFLEDLFGKKIDLAIEDNLKPQIRQKILEDAIDVT
jgi:uncharacterized protein